jgi:hypothetical protein
VRGRNQFTAELRICIPGMFVSAAITGLLDLEAYVEKIQYTKNF